MAENGIRHHRVTPLWPQANGEAERFIKNIKKAVKAATVEEKNWETELQEYLLNYRATPQGTTGLSPAELLYGRKIKTKLPEVFITRNDCQVRERDKLKKAQMKLYADKKRQAVPHNLQEGDHVLLKRPQRLTHQSPYDPDPYIVTRVQGTAITASRGGKRIIRNSSFFKKIEKTQEITADDLNDPVDDTTPTDEDDRHTDTHGNASELPEGEQAPPQAPRREFPIRSNRNVMPPHLKDYAVEIH